MRDIGRLLFFDLLDLAPQHLALGDGDLLLARLTRQCTTQQLTCAGAGQDNELKTIFLWCSFHDARALSDPGTGSIPCWFQWTASTQSHAGGNVESTASA